MLEVKDVVLEVCPGSNARDFDMTSCCPYPARERVYFNKLLSLLHL